MAELLKSAQLYRDHVCVRLVSDIRYRTSRLSVDKIFLIILRVFEKIRYLKFNTYKMALIISWGQCWQKPNNDQVKIIINILKNILKTILPILTSYREH